MADRTLDGLVRLIDMRKRSDKASADSIVEQEEASGATGNAGEVPTCTVDGDDDVEVFEPYGLAGQASASDAMVFAPGGDVDNQVALLSSVAGRPATEPGDKALWTSAGHVIYEDNDGGLTITGKDGAVIDLPASGKVTINAAALAGIEIYVGPGQTVNLGDALADLLTKWPALSAAMAAQFAAGKLVVNGGPAFAAAEAAWNIAIGSNSPSTTKTKGS